MSNLNFFRDPETGLVSGFPYVFKKNGLVDWRKLIDSSFLAPNDKKFTGKTREDLAKLDVVTLKDEDLIIKLFGLRELAMIRGYRSIKHDVVTADRLLAVVRTTMVWIGNFETDMKEVEFCALADAHADNTSDIGRRNLAAIAENKGFVRCVRNFLGIPILGADELGKKEEEFPSEDLVRETGIDPVAILSQALKERGYTFEDLKLKLAKSEKFPDAAGYKGPEDIPKEKLLSVIEKVKSVKAKP